MGLIKEPLEMDFFIDPKPLSKEEIQKIRDYIKADKKSRKKLKANQKQEIHTLMPRILPNTLS